MSDSWTDAQRALCQRYGAPFVPAHAHCKIGVAGNVRTGLKPLNGLRHPPEADTTGWYIWGGTHLSAAPDFFLPLHVEHLADWCALVFPFLGLPPGWRFLIADDDQDVWYDPTLLNLKR